MKQIKNGFTLIELLAVIIILAIVALIATPLILNVIDDSRESANMSEANMILKAVEQLYMVSSLDSDNPMNSKFDGSLDIYDQLDVNGEKPEEGSVIVEPDGDISLKIYQDGKCYVKGFEDSEISSNNSTLEECLPDSSNICTTVIVGGVCQTVDSTVANTEEMKNMAVGELVKNESTNGYYNIVDSVSSSVDGYNIIDLGNGKYATLEKGDKNEVTPEQFGASADGATGFSDALLRALKSGASIVNLDSTKEYRLDKTLSVDSASNVTINGNGATIYTDNSFEALWIESNNNYREWAILFDRSTNIAIDNIKMEARETEDVEYKIQLGIRRTTGVDITNSEFLVFDTAPKFTAEGGRKEYTNLDLYYAWEDVLIDNNKLLVMHSGDAGGNIWVRDFGSYDDVPCRDLIFSNNTLEKNTHDESIGIFLGKMENIQVINNKITLHDVENDDKVVETPTAFSLGYSSSTSAKEGDKTSNILFEGNTVIAYASYRLIYAAEAENVVVKNNYLEFNHSFKDSTNTTVNHVIQGTISEVSGNTIVYNNDTESAATEKLSVMTFASESFGTYNALETRVFDNEITINANVENLFVNAGTVTNNVITVNGTTKQGFLNSLKEVSNNNITFNDNSTHIFVFQTHTFINDVTIRENRIISNYDAITNVPATNPAFLMTTSSAYLNGYSMLIDGNTLTGANLATMGRQYLVNFADGVFGAIRYINNNIGYRAGLDNTGNGTVVFE